MKTTETNIILKKDLNNVLIVTASILMIPFIAMQFTNEVNWNFFDFAVMGVLLSGTGLAVVFASRKVKNTNHRIVVVLALIAVLFLIWAELAVGIFGTPFTGS